MAIKTDATRTIEFEPYATLKDLYDAVQELHDTGIPGDAVVRFSGTVDFHRHGPRVIKITVTPPDQRPDNPTPLDE